MSKVLLQLPHPVKDEAKNISDLSRSKSKSSVALCINSKTTSMFLTDESLSWKQTNKQQQQKKKQEKTHISYDCFSAGIGVVKRFL